MAAIPEGSSAGAIQILVNTVYNGKGFVRAEKDMAKLQGSAAAATSGALAMGMGMERAGRRMSSVGKSMTLGITAPLALIGVKSFQAAHEFQTNMNRMVSLAGITRKEMESMTQPTLELASKYGIMGKEASEALYFIASSGFNASQSMKVLEASMMASATGMGEVQEIADLVTSGISAYGKQNLNASQAVDIMAVAIREGKMESDEMAKTMGSLIPIASELDISFADTAGAMAIMSRAGADAFKGATQLRGIMGALLKPSVQGAEALAEVGLSAEGLRNEIKQKGLYSALMTIRKELGNNKEALAKVFPNVRGLAGFLNLMGKQAKVAGEIMRETNSAVGEGAEAFKKIEGTQQFKYEQAVANLKNAMIELGIAITPVVVTVAKFIGDLASKFNNLPDPIKNVAVAAGIFLAALGPLLMITGTLTGSLGRLTTGYVSLTAAQTANTAAARANAAALSAGAAGYGVQAGAMGIFSAKTAKTTGSIGKLASTAGLLGRFLMGPWGVALGLAATGVIMYKDEILDLFRTTDNFEEKMSELRDIQEQANQSLAAAGPAIKSASEGFADYVANVRAYNRAVENQKQPQMNVQQIKEQAKAVEQSQRAALQNMEKYGQGVKDATSKAFEALKEQADLLSQPGDGRPILSVGNGAEEVNKFKQMIDSKALPSLEKLSRMMKGIPVPKALTAALGKAYAAQFREAAATINLTRVALGKVKLPDRTIVQVGRLFSQLPKSAENNLRAAFSKMKPAAVRETTSMLQKMVSAGKRKEAIKVATKLDPKNANADLEKLRGKVKGLNLPRKKVYVDPILKAMDRAIKVAEKRGKKPIFVEPKLDTFLSKIKEALKTETKTVNISPNFVGNWTTQVTVNEVPGTKVKGGTVGGAMGAVFGPESKPMLKQSAKTGHKVNRPMFMVGEENRTEFVIATNPAYRANNIKYWLEAGNALGIPGFSTGGKTNDKAYKKLKRGVYKGLKDFRPGKQKNWDREINRLEINLAKAVNRPGLEDDLEATRKLEEFYTNTSLSIGTNRGKWRNKTKPKDPRKSKGWKDLKKKDQKEILRKYKEDLRTWTDNTDSMNSTYLDFLGNIKSYKDQVEDLQTEIQGEKEEEQAISIAEQLGAFSQERMALLTSFSGNIRNRASGIMGGASGSMAVSSGGGGSAARATAASTNASAGTKVNITQNYQEPPQDPHAWTREIQNEITALM